ncbi:MAG: hemolysin family protein [Sphingomicrobium sp.]
MSTPPDDPGSRLWRGMRALIFGDDHETSLRDQIEDAIDASETAPTQRGDLSSIERQMLRNLLQFGDRTAGEVAVTRGDIVSVPQTVNFAELVAAFAEAEHSRLPVTGDDLDDVVGMIHIKDVFAALANPGRPRTIEGLLRTPLFVPESMGVLDLLARMRTDRIHLAIVVDEFGGTEGLITIEDVVEEIVGDIEDEHDEEATGNLVLLDEGLWEADARTELEEVAETIDARLIAGEDDIDTLGGLAFLLAGRILTPGESILHPSGWRLESIAADTRRMIRLRLHAPEESTADSQ